MAPFSLFKSEKSPTKSTSDANVPNSTPNSIPSTLFDAANNGNSSSSPSKFTSRLLRRKPSSKIASSSKSYSTTNYDTIETDNEGVPLTGDGVTSDSPSTSTSRSKPQSHNHTQDIDETSRILPLDSPCIAGSSIQRPRRGSEPVKSPGAANRTAWVYGRHSGLAEGNDYEKSGGEGEEEEGEGEEEREEVLNHSRPSRLTPRSSSDREGLRDVFFANTRRFDYNGPPSPRSFSTSASASTSTSDESRNMTTNVVLNKQTTYPTALSPPRRPMPRSPGFNSKSSSSIPPIAEALLSTSASASALSGPSGSGLVRRPSANAEWLARKPSSRRANSNPLNLHLDQPKKRLENAFTIRTPSNSTVQTTHTINSSSSVTGDDDLSRSIDSDGEGEVSNASPGSGMIGRKRISGLAGSSGLNRSSSGEGNAHGGYEVEVVCQDEREGEDGEMIWQVKIRPRPQPSSTQQTSSILEPLYASSSSSSPLNLSTSTSITQSPITASSINLSLSLDQPTGKLVFIAFPMDIHATPRHRIQSSHAQLPSQPLPHSHSHSQSQPMNPGSQPDTNQLISTPPPPPPILGAAYNRPSTPPPSAPRLNSSPPPSTPLSRRTTASEHSMWPSPVAHGRKSPSMTNSNGNMMSPRDRSTPRRARSRMMSAGELDGGLYARGTVDGMSEELESSLNLQYRLGENIR
jgi:hypothetical protein